MAFGYQLDQILLNLDGVSVPGPAQALADATHMRIHNDAGCDPKRLGAHYVGGFARYAGQGQQRIHFLRHFAAVFGNDLAAGGLNVARLAAVEAGGVHH